MSGSFKRRERVARKPKSAFSQPESCEISGRQSCYPGIERRARGRTISCPTRLPEEGVRAGWGACASTKKECLTADSPLTTGMGEVVLSRGLLASGQHLAVQATLHRHWGAALQAGLPATLSVTDTW